jgi:hypothetical protein
VAGAVATGAFKLVDEQRVRDQERRKIFYEIVRVYNQVKSTRRTFKALGVLKTGSRVPLRADEAKELRATMAILNDAQLRLEAIVREIDQSDLFDKKRLIMQRLRIAEDYINKNVLDLWEANGGDVWEGADPTVYMKLRLKEFVAAGFKKNVRIQLDELTKEMHKELFGGRSSTAES